jgi:chromosome segregation ATPase
MFNSSSFSTADEEIKDANDAIVYYKEEQQRYKKAKDENNAQIIKLRTEKEDANRRLAKLTNERDDANRHFQVPVRTLYIQH